MSLRFVPLTPQLLDLALGLCRDPATIALVAAAIARAPEALFVPGVSFAALDGGLLAGAGGLAPCWPGRAGGWWLVTGHARPRHLAAAARYARALLDRVQADPASGPLYRRIEIAILAAAPWRQSFAAALGFELEATMRRWSNQGLDTCQYVRIWEGA